jgi:hypothetical protein
VLDFSLGTEWREKVMGVEGESEKKAKKEKRAGEGGGRHGRSREKASGQNSGIASNFLFRLN